MVFLTEISPESEQDTMVEKTSSSMDKSVKVETKLIHTKLNKKLAKEMIKDPKEFCQTTNIYNLL